MKKRTCYTLDENVINELEKRRKITPASTYLNYVLKKLWKLPEAPEEPK